MKTHCDRCGKDCRRSNCISSIVLPYELIELLPTYKTKYVTHICRSCGDKANAFVNYYGKKKTEDLLALNNYLRNGSRSTELESKLYSMLNNAGYY